MTLSFANRNIDGFTIVGMILGGLVALLVCQVEYKVEYKMISPPQSLGELKVFLGGTPIYRFVGAGNTVHLWAVALYFLIPVSGMVVGTMLGFFCSKIKERRKKKCPEK